MTTTLDRRSFVKVTAVAGAGFALAFHLPGCSPAKEEGPDTDLNAFLMVKADGSVVVTSKHMEMGQGAYTGLATILAEEMDADWAKVSVVGAPGDVKRYANNQMGMQLTGGCSTIANSFEQMRKAGAAAFTQDIQLPGMLTAVVAHPPRFGAKVKSFTSTAAKGVPGVVDVVQVPSGVAVLANDFWSAKKGREALTIQWDETDAEERGSAQLWKEYEALARLPGKDAGKRGNATRALAE